MNVYRITLELDIKAKNAEAARLNANLAAHLASPYMRVASVELMESDEDRSLTK